MFETENGFYKREENRTNNTRVLDTTEILYCDCIIAEFEAANRLYQAGQKHYPSEHLFVEPYELEERNGEINGYTMEVLEGHTLEHHISPKRNGEIDNLNVSKVKQQLKRASEVIENRKRTAWRSRTLEHHVQPTIRHHNIRSGWLPRTIRWQRRRNPERHKKIRTNYKRTRNINHSLNNQTKKPSPVQ